MTEENNEAVEIEIERYHKFNEKELDRLQQRWVPWPTSDKFVEFNEKKLVKRAVKARHYQYDNSPSYWADMGVVRSDWGYTDGILSKGEAAFWFSLCVVKGYIYGNYDDPEVTEDWVRERMNVVQPDDDPDTFFKAMTDNNIFDDYYGYQQICARFLRELAPYDKTLEFLTSNVDISYLGGWVTELGPPPEDMRDAALEVMKKAFDQVNYDNLWLGSNISKMLCTIPYQKAISELLERHVKNKRDWDSDTIMMAFQLDDKEQCAEYLKHIKRWSYNRPSDDEIKRFFGYFGYENLDILFTKLIYHYRKKSDFKSVLKTAFKIKAPEVVESTYNYLRLSALKPLVEEYALSGEPYALEGLLRLCHSRSKKRDFALSMMRQMVSEDESKAVEIKKIAEAHHPGRIVTLIEEEFFGSGDEIKVRASMDYMPKEDLSDWMKRFLEVNWPGAKGEDTGCPDWLRPESMPPLYIKDDERAIPYEVTDGFFAAARWAFDDGAPHGSLKGKELKAFKKQCEDDIHSLFEEVRPNCTEHLIIELMRVWDATQNPEHGQWVLALAGERGGVAVTAAVDHYVREARDYTARRLHRDEAKHAIRVLAELDSPEARHDLFWQTLHLQDDNLRRYAVEILKAYKSEHDLDDDEFEDTAVPAFDLERGGTRLFDFGTRQIKLIVRGRHDIEFQDPESKKIFARWPPQRKSDDSDMYSAARDQYMHISEPLRNIFIEQNARMEKLMQTGRQWKSERWAELIGDHPILGHLARRLLWKVVDKDFNTVSVVLPDAEGTFMNLDFEEVTPDPKQHKLALVHPIELTDDERTEWVEQLADFEIIQPFDQLERTVYHKENAEEDIKDLSGYMEDRVLLNGCEMGWEPVAGRWNSVNTLGYTAPGDDKQIRVNFSGYLEKTSDGRLRKSSYSYISFSEILLGDGNSKVLSGGKITEKHFKRVSPIAWSEAMYLVKSAIAAKK